VDVELALIGRDLAVSISTSTLFLTSKLYRGPSGPEAQLSFVGTPFSEVPLLEQGWEHRLGPSHGTRPMVSICSASSTPLACARSYSSRAFVRSTPIVLTGSGFQRRLPGRAVSGQRCFRTDRIGLLVHTPACPRRSDDSWVWLRGGSAEKVERAATR
jgi:hypothetical protein